MAADTTQGSTDRTGLRLELERIKSLQQPISPHFLRKLAEATGIGVFIETGTFYGDTTASAAEFFRTVHTIELSAELCDLATQRFSGSDIVRVHHGESAAVLAELLPAIKEPVMFWLDAHYSEANTACGQENTPILGELSVIRSVGIRDAIILIDDIRCFQMESAQTRDSLRGYPTVHQIREAIYAIDPQAEFLVLGDVVCATLGNVNVVPSEVVTACTISRAYESGDMIEQVLKSEEVIAACAGSEKTALMSLPDDFEASERFGLGGHFRLWRGLIHAREGRFAEACDDLLSALKLGCAHWRVRWYLAQALHAVGESKVAGELLATVLNEVPGFAPACAMRESMQGLNKPPSATAMASTGEDLAIKKCIGSGSVVFDVGANVGDWTRAALENAPDIEVHLFEASPSTFARLRSTFAASNQSQLVFNQLALGNQRGTRTFHHYTDAPAWSTFYRRVEAEKLCGKQAPSEVTVATETLDGYTATHSIARINYLKIDTEGAEYEVLLGASQLLSRGAIDYIQFEYGGTYADAGTTLRLVDALLRRFGYAIFRIGAAGFEQIEAYSVEHENFEYSNFLAVNERLVSQFLGRKAAMLDLEELLKKFGVTPRGVIHIGAHEGREAEVYSRLGIERMLFVEANPAIFPRLVENLRQYPGAMAIHCAVSDADGTENLHVTSMDQSSSILPLGRHKDIYPDIVESATVQVPARTVDSLLEERGLDGHVYNVMNIDIQGAELLALRGSEKTLRHIEAINTEINYDELYEGCARLDELDGFLDEHGFTRVATTTPFHPSWGDALYIRKPVVCMSTLGSNGRFANQIFQYAFLKIHARQHGCRVAVPDWIGRQLFGAADAHPDATPLREVRQTEQELLTCDIANAPEPLRNVDFWGYFQYHTRYYAAHKTFFRSLFKPVEPLRAQLETAVKRLQARGRTLVGLHLRRGDYGYRFFYVTPSEWYRRWLASIWHELDDPVLFIASDDPDAVLDDFADYDPVTVRDLGIDTGVPEFYQDFYLLSRCDQVAISNSSFSFAACMLNEHATTFMRPDLKVGELVAFDPWNSEPLLRNAFAEDYGPPFLVQANAEADVRRRHAEKSLSAPSYKDRMPGHMTHQPIQSGTSEAERSSLRVSVYITSFNQKHWLAEAIDSVLAQTLGPHEIIIVDDASSDGSQALIESYCQRYPDLINPIFHHENRGITHSRIDALQAVTGDFVTYLDGDDRFLPDKLAREVAVLTQYPEAELVYSNFYFMDAEGTRTAIWAEETDVVHTGWILPHVFARNFPKRTLFRNELVARAALERSGFHDPAIDVFEDFELRIRLTHGVQAVYCDHPLSEYRRHTASLSHARLAQQLQALDYIFTKNCRLLRALPLELRDAVIESYQAWVGSVILPAVERQVAGSTTVERRSRSDGGQVIPLLDTPWSGATLLLQTLGAHPAVQVGQDTGVLSMFAGSLSAIHSPDPANQYGGIGVFLAGLANGERIYSDMARGVVCELYAKALQEAGAEVLIEHSASHVYRLDEIRRLLPGAPALFLVRHPLAIFDTACLQKSAQLEGPCRRTQDLADDHDYLETHRRILKAIEAAGPAAIVVHFEDLAQRPEQTLRRLCARLDLVYDAAMLQYANQFAALAENLQPMAGAERDRTVWVERILARGDGTSARRFLESLGEDVVEGLGYDYRYAHELLENNAGQVVHHSNVQSVSQATAELPNGTDALIKSGESRFAAGDLDGARELFLRAIELDPRCGEAFNNLGVLCWEQGSVADALTYLSQGLAVTPQDRSLVVNTAAVLVAIQRPEEAAGLYESYLSIHPGDGDIADLLAALPPDGRRVSLAAPL